MLLPMMSRFLLVAFRPERPCWKLMERSCGGMGWVRCVGVALGEA
jgi:hypothetical protein